VVPEKLIIELLQTPTYTTIPCAIILCCGVRNEFKTKGFNKEVPILALIQHCKLHLTYLLLVYLCMEW
jgi:hypothetical protein